MAFTTSLNNPLYLSKMRFGLLLFLIPLFCCSSMTLAAPMTAKIGPFLIKGENLERDVLQQITLISGAVEVVYGTQTLRADQVRIDQKNDRAQLFGNVIIQTADYELGGTKIDLDYISNQAIVHDGYVQTRNTRFQGRLIERTSQNDFYVLDAEFTNCNNCPSTWSFNGSVINAKLGGYAYIKNAFLRVGGVPVFWLPYLALPLKNERQTGLLTPEIGFTDSRGLTYSQSLFWAKSRSDDATFTLKTYEHGGVKQLVEYRYSQSLFSYGQFNFSHFQDSLFQESSRYNAYLENSEKKKNFNRWNFTSLAQYDFLQKSELAFDRVENQSLLRTQFQLISDLQSPKDFSDEFKNYAQSSLENKINYTYSGAANIAQIEAVYFKHLLQANPLSASKNAVHKLPELRLDSTIQPLGNTPFYGRYKLSYNNFFRNKKYDDITVQNSLKFVSNPTNDPQCEYNGAELVNCDPTSDGQFDENQDIIRTGQRLNFNYAVIGKTLSLADSINIYPQLRFDETHYVFPVGKDRSHERRFFQFEVLSRSKLYRIFDSEEKTEIGAPTNRKKHEFIPELHYTWIPWIDQKSHPFFGNTSDGQAPFSSKSNISDNDVNSKYGIQYDFQDRVYDRHLLTVVLLNRVLTRDFKDTSAKPLLDYRLSQSYDVYQANQTETFGQPLSNLSGIGNIYVKDFTITSQFDYFHYKKATDSSTAVTYLNSQQRYFKIGYNANRSASTNQDDVSFAIGFVTNYLNLLTGIIVDANKDRSSESRLKQHSLIAQFKPPGECWAINFFRDQKISQKAEWKIQYEFSWDGNPPKVIPPGVLKIN